MFRAFLVALFLWGMAGSAAAEPGPIGEWLMNESLTLWDWGMFKADKEAERAAEFVGRDIGKAYGGARYDWDTNEIEIYMNAGRYPYDTSHENCNKVRRRFIGYIAWGSDLTANEDRTRSFLSEVISQWFSHEGWQRKVRDKELGEKMSRIIFVKVRLWSKDGVVTCKDRIMVFEAPSKPSLL